MTLLYANLVKHGNGLSAEVIDSSWRMSLITYDDTPTRMSSSNPPWIFAARNGPARSSGKLTFTLGVTDPDSNQSPPLIVVHHRLGTGQPDTLNANTLGDTLVRRQLQIPSGGAAQFADTQITVTLGIGQVSWWTRRQVSLPVPTCTTSYWALDTFMVSGPFSDYGDTLVIRVGGDVIRLYDTTHSVTALHNAPLAAFQAVVQVIDRDGRRVGVCGAPTGGAVRIEVFTADGRLVCTAQSPDSRITLPARLAPGMYRARVASVSGAHRTTLTTFTVAR
jgi:hypothetical protein